MLVLSGFTSVIALTSGSAGASAASGTGTLTLSQSVGVPVWRSYYSDFGDRVWVTGSGFPPGQDGIQIAMVPFTSPVVQTVAHGCTSGDVCDLGSLASEFDPSIAGTNRAAVMADVNGWFRAQVDTPAVRGGGYLVYAIYPRASGKVVTATQSFTVIPAVYVVSDLTGSPSSGPQEPVQLAGVGFGRGEQIRPAPSSFFANAGHATITAGSTPGVNEGTFDVGPETTDSRICTGLTGAPYCVGNLPEGPQTLTILGVSSGSAVPQTFTIVPQIAFWSAPGCTRPTYSIDTGAGASFCMSGTGFQSGEAVAAAGTATVGGVPTTHGEIISDGNGAFGPTVVTLARGTGAGLLNVVLGGNTFSYSSGNIYQPSLGLADRFRGVLVGSHAGQGASVTLPEGASSRVGEQGVMVGYGYGPGLAYGGNNLRFVLNPTSIPFLQVAPANGGDATESSATDANGAFVALFVAPVAQHFAYTLHDSTPSNAAPDSTYTVNPDVRLSSDSTSAGLKGRLYLVHGISGGSDSQSGLAALGVAGPPLGDLTVYINGVFWAGCRSVGRLCDSNLLGNGQLSADTLLPALGSIPSTDLPQGEYEVNITGIYRGDWASGRYFVDSATGMEATLTVDPIALAGSLGVSAGKVGTTVPLQTGPAGGANPGIHGLEGNSPYSIMWDGTIQVGTFTSTASGGVPAGTKFTVPPSATGLHLVDVQARSGSSAVWGRISNHSQSQFLNLIFTVSTMTLACSPSTMLLGTSAACKASVEDPSSSGRVTWSKAGGSGRVTFSSASCTLRSGGCMVNATGFAVGPVILNGTYSGDTNHPRQSLTIIVTVISVKVSCIPSLVVVGSTSTCKATVSGTFPTGRLTWSSAGQGKFSLPACTLSKETCSVRYTPTSASSPVNITTSYLGDRNNPPSSGGFSLQTLTKVSSLALYCAPVTVAAGSSTPARCTAKVSGYLPSGQVAWTQSGSGSVSFSAGTCNLANRLCSVALAGAKSGAVTVRASYGGDSDNTGSSGSSMLTVSSARVRLDVLCTTSMTVGIVKPCSATLVGYAGSVAGEKVAWSLSVGKGRIRFSSPACTLTSRGTCTINVTGTSSGVAKIEASYGGDSSNAPVYTLIHVTVGKTATQVSLSCTPANLTLGATATCTASISGYHANGTVTWADILGTGKVTLWSSKCTLSLGACSVGVTATKPGSVVIKATYHGDPGNNPSFKFTTLTCSGRNAT